MILDFKQFFTLCEIGEGNIETKRGAELFGDPAMEAAMYIAYRQAYDPINKKDRDEEIAHHTGQGLSPEEAERKATTSATAWSHGEWTYPSSGGTRAPEWIFTGVFPNEQDLNTIRQMMGGGQPMEAFGNRKNHSMQIQKIGDQIMQSGQLPMSYVGGLAWRDDNPGSIKIVGTWGNNGIAKMRGAAQVVSQANEKGLEIFTGADAQLKQMIDKAEKTMPSFHKKGLVPSPTLGLQSPPKEVIPLLYDILTNHPGARGSGSWTGYNPETGGMKYQLSGSGEREKFIFGNKPMWKSQIGKALQGVQPQQLAQAKQALQAGGMMGNMAANMINQRLQQRFPNAGAVPASGLLWLLSQVE